jgi:hypothetical protein
LSQVRDYATVVRNDDDDPSAEEKKGTPRELWPLRRVTAPKFTTAVPANKMGRTTPGNHTNEGRVPHASHLLDPEEWETAARLAEVVLRARGRWDGGEGIDRLGARARS